MRWAGVAASPSAGYGRRQAKGQMKEKKKKKQRLTPLAEVGTKPSDIENKVTVSSIARRRLAVVMCRLKMAETVSDVSCLPPF